MFVAAGEDDGYLMVYVTKPDGTSYMHVYDAATMDATPVAEVRGGRMTTAAVAVLGCSRHGHFRCSLRCKTCIRVVQGRGSAYKDSTEPGFNYSVDLG